MLNRPVSRLFAAPFLLFAVALVAACDDPFAAFLQDVPEEPVETTLFDFIGRRLEDPPAFDVLSSTRARVDLTSSWDFLFRIENGEPQLAPFSVVTDSVTDAGLQVATTSFEAIQEAPKGGYQIAEPTPIAVGDVLFARSRADPAQGLLCSRYAKLEVLDIDLASGTLTFRYLANPNCGDVVLVPGTHGDL